MCFGAFGEVHPALQRRTLPMCNEAGLLLAELWEQRAGPSNSSSSTRVLGVLQTPARCSGRMLSFLVRSTVAFSCGLTKLLHPSPALRWAGAPVSPAVTAASVGSDCGTIGSLRLEKTSEAVESKHLTTACCGG